MIETHSKKTITTWERGLYTIKKIIIIILIIITIILIGILGYTIHIKQNNEKTQKQIETTIKEIENKEKEIKNYKEQLEEYKKLKQQSDAQLKTIEELEIITNELNEEIEDNKYKLEEIKDELYNY